jgi:hypothetical protein
VASKRSRVRFPSAPPQERTEDADRILETTSYLGNDNVFSGRYCQISSKSLGMGNLFPMAG